MCCSIVGKDHQVKNLISEECPQGCFGQTDKVIAYGAEDLGSSPGTDLSFFLGVYNA